MEVFLLLVLGVVVIWLAMRQSNASTEIASFINQIARLEQRLSRLEESFQRLAAGQASAKTAAEAPPAPVEAKIAPPTPPASASHAAAAPPSPYVRAPQIQPALETPAAQPAPQPPPVTAPVPPEQSAPPTFMRIPAPARSLSIEERLGANWLNKIGIVSVVIGVALFLALKLHTLGPAGKVAVGYVLSAVFLVGGLLLERRPTYRIFARAAIGGGWALTFFVTFAMYHVEATRVVTSQTADLILMLLVAIGMVLHSLRYRSQVVTTLAFVLAFVTVALSDVTLFTLVASALLATGLVFVAAREYWYELQLAGLLCVYLNHFHWLEGLLHYGAPPAIFPDLLPSAALLIFYWLLFRLAYVLRAPRSRREEGLAAITAILNSFGLLGLLKLQSMHPEWAFYALLVLGAAEGALAFFAWRRRRPAFVVLSSIAAVLLLAAIPFRFSGANWSLLWLLQAEAIFFAGLRLREVVFRRLGLIAGFAAAAHLILLDALPILDLRQSHADLSPHAAIVVAMLAGALLLWMNSQLAPLRWREIFVHEIDEALLIATSFTALGLSALGLWIVFPTSGTIVAWMVLALLLSVAADLPKYLRRGSAEEEPSAASFAFGHFVSRLASQLAMQADLLAIAAIIRIFSVNLNDSTLWLGNLSERAITVGVASAIFYLITIRRTGFRADLSSYIAPAYSWAATSLLSLLVWTELRPSAIAFGWAAIGLALFEFGRTRRLPYLRHQGYALQAASFLRLLAFNFFAALFASSHAGPWHLDTKLLYAVLPLVAAYLWIYERLYRDAASLPASHVDRALATVAAWAALVALTALAWFEVAPDWAATGTAVLVVVLLVAGWAFNRAVFVAQAITLVLISGSRAILYNLTAMPAGSAFWNLRLYTVAAPCAILLLALPVAFLIRKRQAGAETQSLRVDSPADAFRFFFVQRPEQLLFFVPLGVMTIFLAVQMRAGAVTVAWSALGVVVFLFALAVRERSYRLSGLGLLMLGVGKIVCVDIWSATVTDRIITLIVMGVALLLVSFLYSRYRETILKFL
jgi:uncharacterized membrane protein